MDDAVPERDGFLSESLAGKPAYRSLPLARSAQPQFPSLPQPLEPEARLEKMNRLARKMLAKLINDKTISISIEGLIFAKSDLTLASLD